MRLLDRYLMRELMIPLIYCLSGFLIFWISFDLLSELDDYQEARLQAMEVFELYLVKLPELLTVVIPVALLLSLLYTLTNHARHQELTALRSAGLSLWRLCLVYFAVGIVFSLGLFAFNELWVPQNAELAELIMRRHEAEQNQDPDWHYNLNFRNSRAGRFWRIGAYHLETGEMKNPLVTWNHPHRQIIADWAVRSNRLWVFHQVVTFTLTSPDTVPARSQTNVLALPELTETPEQIKRQIKFSKLSSFKAAKKMSHSLRELGEYLEWDPEMRPSDRRWLSTLWHDHLAHPWTCLVVVVIAIPFGSGSGRRNVFVGVASSLLIGFSYFFLREFSLAFGAAGYLSPGLAAWLPNIIFGAIGLWLTHQAN